MTLRLEPFLCTQIATPLSILHQVVDVPTVINVPTDGVARAQDTHALNFRPPKQADQACRCGYKASLSVGDPWELGQGLVIANCPRPWHHCRIFTAEAHSTGKKASF